MRMFLNNALFLAIFLPLQVTAGPDTTGIIFTQDLSWDEIKLKAKTENKYIFVDGYATWCGPCKMMDKEVYPNDSVGTYINPNFISVKVQMDTTKSDSELTKKWYRDAHELMQQGLISSFPTYLFFAPDGNLVHKGVGFKDPLLFIALAKDATAPEKQYFTLISKYKNGSKDYGSMPYLAMTALQFNDTAIANAISRDYINNFLSGLSKSKLYTAENIQFICAFTRSTRENGFKMLFNNEPVINKVMKNPDYAQSFLHYLISKEVIDPVMVPASKSKNTDIDWNELKSTIYKKYNAYYADRSITDAKTRWYAHKQDWPEFSKYTIDFVEKYGSDMNDFTLATKAWSIFEHSNDKQELTKAVAWAKKIMDRTTDSTNVLPAVMDTYANLQYKIDYLFENNKSNATVKEMEERALALAMKYNIENYISEFKSIIEKMNKKEPTW